MLIEMLVDLLVPDMWRLLEPVGALQQEAHLVGVLGQYEGFGLFDVVFLNEVDVCRNTKPPQNSRRPQGDRRAMNIC
jgi:hypothetical protein